MKTLLLLLIFSISSFQLFGQALSYEAKDELRKTFACYESEDWECAMLGMERVFAEHGDELTAKQMKSMQKNLRNWYLDVIIEVEVPAERTSRIRQYATKGIDLGNKVGRRNDMHDFLFHYFMVVYYYYQDNETQMDNWTRKLDGIKRNLTEEASLKAELNAWAYGNIRTMKRSMSSSGTSFSLNLGKLLSSFSSGGSSGYSDSNRSNSHSTNEQRAKSGPSSTAGQYKFIKTISHSDHTEFIYKCGSGDYFTIRKFKESGKVYGSGVLMNIEYKSVTEAAAKHSKSNCR